MPNVVSELVNSGVTFTNGHVTTALCCPSRASILSGQYAHRTGVLDNNPPDGGVEVFDDSSTIATWLQAAGYRTGFVGKYLNGYNLSPYIPPGWDEWHVQVQVKFYEYDLNDNGVITHFGSAPADYSGDVMTQRAVDFILSSAGPPFFLHLSQKAPHGPATPAPRHLGLFAGLAPFRPPNYALAPTNGPAWVQAETWTAQEQSSTDQFRIDQLESLQAVDEGVRAIMDALRAIGEDDNTLVIYTSDNGFSWGSHKWRPKQCPYQECMRVPMIMRYPPLGTTARTDDRFVLNIDFAPTIVELAARRCRRHTSSTARVSSHAGWHCRSPGVRRRRPGLAQRHAQRALERHHPDQRAGETGAVQRDRQHGVQEERELPGRRDLPDLEVRRVHDRRDRALQPDR